MELVTQTAHIAAARAIIQKTLGAFTKTPAILAIRLGALITKLYGQAILAIRL